MGKTPIDMQGFISKISYFIFLFLAGCGASGFLSDKPPASPDSTMKMKGFEAYATTEGKPQYIIDSDDALLKEKLYCIEMKKIHLTFFKEGEEGKTGTLTSDNGLYFFRDNPSMKRKKNDIDLKGHVLFNTSDGTSLKTPEVHYESASEKIYSSAGFEKRKEGGDQTIVIKGKSFVTDKNLRKWEDTGATMTVETKPTPIKKKEK